MVTDCAREVSLVLVSCVMMYVFVAPPTLVGAWSMTLVLWQLIEYFIEFFHTTICTHSVASQSQETPAVVYETVGEVGATTGPATSENVAYGVPDIVPTSHNPAYGHLPQKK